MQLYKLSAAPEGIILNEKLLNKGAAAQLSFLSQRYIERAQYYLSQMTLEDWDLPKTHNTHFIPILAKVNMLLALAAPQTLNKYSPEQPRDDHGRWSDGSAEDTESNSDSGNNIQTQNHSQEYDTADSGEIKTDANVDTSGFNAKNAAEFANDNAEDHPTKNCARYVADAIRSQDGGGITNLGHPESGYAKDYGPELEDAGFTPVSTASEKAGNAYPLNSYTPQTGDVAVIQPYPHGNAAGHMAMYDGNIWISDFKQIDMWGGQGRRAYQPPYVIYRYPQ